MPGTTITRKLRIGVDVGGTNTDSVLLDGAQRSNENRGVVEQFKTATTPDVTDGIEIAVKAILTKASVDVKSIASLTIGTTHFINAVVENDARRLSKVAVIRLSGTFTRLTPPFSDFPPALKQITEGYYSWVSGGLHIDGSESSPLKEEEVVKECQKIKELGIKSVVVVGVFSPIDDTFQQEKRARDIIVREMSSDVDVICSHEVANLGLIERENAAILNASILKFARRTIRGFRAAMKRLDLKCGLYLTTNNGTLVDAATASKYPITTFSSGATNSMAGAAYLGGLDVNHTTSGKRQSTIVIDVGGTTTDIGMLMPSGFPRQASAYVTVAGVRINYSMPHIESIGLGGGSIVRVQENGEVTVGPDSVGHYLVEKARVFGGDVLTATDITVAKSGCDIGDPGKVSDIDVSLVEAARAKIQSKLDAFVDLVKTSPDPLPVLLVGGGSIIAGDTISGVSRVIRPPFHDVANAVGAAIAKVGGTVDTVENTSVQTVAEAIENAKQKAIERAVAAGADRNTVYIAEVDSMPLQYVTNQVRIIVKAVGELDVDREIPDIKEDDDDDEQIYELEIEKAQVLEDLSIKDVDPLTYRPTIKNGEWFVSETDLKWMGAGFYVMGCAGGGSPHGEVVQLRDILREGHTIRIIDSASLKDDALIMWGGHMGSPAVSIERLGADETVDAMHELIDYMKLEHFDGVMSLEAAGGNGLQPMIVGSSKHFDRPILDADWMGRAYPTYWQTTIAVYEEGQLVPATIASGDGKHLIMTKTSNDEIVDRALRAACAEMGSRVGMACKPVTINKVRKYAVLNTLSMGWRIGRVIATCAATNTQNRVTEALIDEVGGLKSAKKLFVGKITAVERRLFKGHSYGEITIDQLATDEVEEGSEYDAVAKGGCVKIPFKNENLYVEHHSPTGQKKMVAMVPDLIAVLDSQSGYALGVPEYRYGLRVTVLGITCSPRWTDTPRGIEIGGPRAFGLVTITFEIY